MLYRKDNPITPEGGKRAHSRVAQAPGKESAADKKAPKGRKKLDCLSKAYLKVLKIYFFWKI
jgi:hypothetical protein